MKSLKSHKPKVNKNHLPHSAPSKSVVCKFCGKAGTREQTLQHARSKHPEAFINYSSDRCVEPELYHHLRRPAF